MYPNPQDALPLPPHPDVDHYRKRAKELVKACQAGEPAVQAWATQWVDRLFQLQPDVSAESRRQAARHAGQVAEYAKGRMQGRCELSQAQFVMARAHGFASWERLMRHIDDSRSASPVSAFERAASLVVGGDLPGLEEMLRADPGLVRARSDREHGATLLHYVSANGVETYRQKTPANIVVIARLLLDAGAEVDAEADVYGGGATTLGLVVTSAHPRAAGVQLALADLLLERGARIDAGIVRSCLMNGCPEAAAHMAVCGAPFGLQEACGIGRLDVVERAFAPDGQRAPADAVAGLMMASWYDQQAVAAFLLDHGVEVGARDPENGATALHIAAYKGSPGLVKLLLARGAPVNVNDGQYGTPPFVWAMHAWLVEGRGSAADYEAVLRQLVAAGATVQAAWLEDERVGRVVGSG